MPNLSVGIIGMGPRGLSLLERLIANINSLSIRQEIIIHVIDSNSIGPGKVWRTDQSKHLLANTVASQVTVFTDESVDCEGPIVPGPSLYDWAKYLAYIGFDEQYDEEIIKEAQELQPDSYPTRAFYGHYLRWVYKRLIENLPSNIKVYSHVTTAIGLDDLPIGKQIIYLKDEPKYLIVDAVVLSLGHIEVALTDKEKELQNFANNLGLYYIPPSNPSDICLDDIEPGEPVILRGLGLNFFDYMALFTTGRGGKFVRKEGKLKYIPSGKEPRLYAGSRRGIPYHARGENEKGAFGCHQPLFLTNSTIKHFHEKVERGEKINFKEEVWPLITKEVKSVYYAALISSSDCSCKSRNFLAEYINVSNEDEEKNLLNKFGISSDKWWDWDKIAYPYKDQKFFNKRDFDKWLINYLYNDFFNAKGGNVSNPLKAALDALRDLRNEIRLIVDYGGLNAKSHKDDLDGWYTPLNAFLSIGPPASRIEEMIALLEAGVLEIFGPNMTVECDSKNRCFKAYSPLFENNIVEAKYLIEARLPSTNINRTTNPLLRYLLETGQCSSFVISGTDGSRYDTGGLAVTNSPSRIINSKGFPHPRRFAIGVPTEGVHWVTFAGIRPGVNSVTLSETDAIAREILRLTEDSNDGLLSISEEVLC
ncbi:FAD/NAD(P)-binding protein [Parageobacillus thermoglucosidasius]|uniref:FAD/NAD(P)-binding protein n=1 Tax=Parageobacillus thermoglucosidasius TaxID=1426 RepID=UPI0027F8EE2C|nr:FAD/NAD(P)-binding protein [Parageobacillus thermoglucosidasius]